MEPTKVDEDESVRIASNQRNCDEEPLRILAFQFQGYAIWLDLEQQQPLFLNPTRHTTMVTVDETKTDLDDALRTASAELGVAPIPAPHVTALYGIQHLSEDEVRQRFQDVANHLFWFKQRWLSWPLLEPLGFLSDVEIAGKNGGQMTMAWIEVTFKTSQEHETLIDHLFQCFYNNTGKVRTGPWHPHLSLAYDNEDRPISQGYLQDLVERFPTLALPRRVESLSLWNLNGTIDQWSLVDRISL